MKKFVSIILIFAMIFSLTGCGSNGSNGSNTSDAANQSKPGEGKIAVITSTISQNEEEYRSAQNMVAKYGDRIIHETWPENFMTEQEQMVSIVGKIASNSDIKALCINPAFAGTNAAIDKLLEVRDDMLIIYCGMGENPPDSAKRADICTMPNELQLGFQIPTQAKAMGAKTLVHYSFPRHMADPLLSGKRSNMKIECEKLGIEFIDATAPDPTGDSGVPGAQQFILEDVPKMIEKYGKDTAFFATNCSMQVPMIEKCIEYGAIYPMPCCPSPLHGFPAALGIEISEDKKGDVAYVTEQITKKLDEKGVLGRYSTWPVPVTMMTTVAGIEYSIKWMEGKTNGKVDPEVLRKCMSDEAGVNIELAKYEENGVTYDNILLITMDTITFGDK